MPVMQRPRRLAAFRLAAFAALAALAAVALADGRARAQAEPPAEPASPAPPPATTVEPAAPEPPPAAPAPAATTTPPAPPPAAPPAPPPQPPYAPPFPASLQEVRAPIPPPGSTRIPADDPQADRGVAAPTAYTHPKGTYYFSDYELALLQLGYAITDDTQVTFTGVPPLGAERILILDITLKSTLYRGGLVRVAALGSTSGLAANEVGVIGVGRVGGVVQLCLAHDCASSLSLSTNVTLASALFMLNGATGIFRVGRTTSLLAELDTLVPLGKDTGEINGGLASGGVRFGWTNWGLDLALMRVLGSNAITLPFVALTYRSEP
jgi:hypothetical protein